MQFKRILYSAIALFAGLSLGILGAPAVASFLGLPNDYRTMFTVAVPCALIVALAVYLICGRIFANVAELTKAEQQQMQRRWAWLKPVGVAKRSPFPINKSQVIIGRDIKCDILLLNDSISRRHAEIVRDGSGWSIRDLSSSNGTFVNGQAVTGSQLLKEGDSVTLGDITLTFEGPSVAMTAEIADDDISFPATPEAVVSLDPNSTAVHQFMPTGTGTQAMGQTQAVSGTVAMGGSPVLGGTRAVSGTRPVSGGTVATPRRPF